MNGYFLTWKTQDGTTITYGIYSKQYMLETYLKLLHKGNNISELKFFKQYKNGKQEDITGKVNLFISD